MPRSSRAQMETHREAITASASRLFRERGIGGVSISDLMGDAGLTHGGFYGHFGSKDELAASACSEAFLRSSERWRRRVGGKTAGVEAMSALVTPYLSTNSRDKPGTGCPAAALASDVAREPAEAAVRAAFVGGVERLLEVIASVSASDDADLGRQRAMATLSTMVGGLLLARALGRGPMSEEILYAAREGLIQGV